MGSMSSLHSTKSAEHFDVSKIRLPKLHQAAKTGHVMKIDKELRKSGIDTRDKIGRTAIHIAAIHDKVSLSQIFFIQTILSNRQFNLHFLRKIIG